MPHKIEMHCFRHVGQRFFSESEILCLPDEGVAEQQDKAPDDALEDEESDSDSEDSGTITEIRFVPSDKAACECVEQTPISSVWASLL